MMRRAALTHIAKRGTRAHVAMWLPARSARRLSLAQDEVLGSDPSYVDHGPGRDSYGVKVRLHQKALPHNASPLRPTSTYKRRSKALCRVGRGRGDPNLR